MSDSDCSDVYDWPEALLVGRKLSAFEQLLLCPICQGFLNNAHMLKCGHSYCSICIRKHLDSTLNRTSSDTCPSCREKADSFDLKKNSVLSNIVRSFRSMRSDVLKLVESRSSSDPSEPGDCRDGTTGSHGSTVAKGTAICKRIPHYSFHGMKKDKVKTTLMQLTAESKVKIRLDGEKDVMERRLREFIHLHNAQIGSEQALSLESVIKSVNDSETQLERESYKSARTVNKLDKVRNGEMVQDVESNFSLLVQKVREQKDLALKKIAAQSNDPPAAQPTGRTRSASKGSISQNSQPSQPSQQHLQARAGPGGVHAGSHPTNAAGSSASAATTDRLPLPSISQSAQLVGRLENLLEQGYDWGPWRVVMSQRLGRPFFYNSITKIGQFAVPPELNVIPSPTQSPAHSQLQSQPPQDSGGAHMPMSITSSSSSAMPASIPGSAHHGNYHGQTVVSTHHSAPPTQNQALLPKHVVAPAPFSSVVPAQVADSVEREFTEYLRACDEEEESPFHLLWDGDADYPGSSHPQHTFHHEAYHTSHQYPAHHHPAHSHLPSAHAHMGAAHSAGYTNVSATAASTAIDLPDPTPFPRDAHYSGFTSTSGNTSYSVPTTAHGAGGGTGYSAVNGIAEAAGYSGQDQQGSSSRASRSQSSAGHLVTDIDVDAFALVEPNNGADSSAEPAKWSCRACTFLNYPHTYTCEICHTVDSAMQNMSSKPLLRSRNNSNVSQGAALLFPYGSQNPRSNGNGSGNGGVKSNNSSVGRKTKNAGYGSAASNKKSKK